MCFFATLALASWVFHDYKNWIAFGNGAPPTACNPYGYALFQIQKVYLLWILRLRIDDAKPLRTDSCQSSFLSRFKAGHRLDVWPYTALPIRTGARPALVHWILPQRVAPPYRPSKALGSAIKSILADVTFHWRSFCSSSMDPEIRALMGVPSIAVSRLEGQGDSIVLEPNAVGIQPCSVSKQMCSEVAHIHGQDMSFHVLLAPADAAAVVEAKYGVRFAISGQKAWTGRHKGQNVPSGFVLVYPPRDEMEIKIVKQIIMAGIAFALCERPQNIM